MAALRKLPQEFTEGTKKSIARIVHNNQVLGVMHFNQDNLELCTLPETTSQALMTLPALSNAIQRAVVEITESINHANPIVDRLMEDESIEGVIMTNREGAPILTNTNIVGAAHYGLALQSLATMVQAYIKEMDTFDNVLVMRLQTKKLEVMLSPNEEFNIIVVQHSRRKIKSKKKQSKS